MERSDYPVHKRRLDQQGHDSDYDGMTPEARLAMIWTLTVQAWMFKEGRLHEQRLRRDVVRVLRDGR